MSPFAEQRTPLYGQALTHFQSPKSAAPFGKNVIVRHLGSTPICRCRVAVSLVRYHQLRRSSETGHDADARPSPGVRYLRCCALSGGDQPGTHEGIRKMRYAIGASTQSSTLSSDDCTGSLGGYQRWHALRSSCAADLPQSRMSQFHNAGLSCRAHHPRSKRTRSGAALKLSSDDRLAYCVSRRSGAYGPVRVLRRRRRYLATAAAVA